MKIFGVVALLTGLVVFVFAGAAYLELRAAGTAAELPSADELPLTKIVAPELFDPDHASTRPSDLAALGFKRIWMIGGTAIGVVALGIVPLMAAKKDATVRDRGESR